MSRKTNKLLVPFVKWVGGKRQLLDEIRKYLPSKYSTYYEPFVGGGAMFFSLQPKKAIINDINEELINIYRVIRDNSSELIEDLKKHKNEEKYFYEIRELDRDKYKYSTLSNIKRASRIIYLNKTCYNGLFRVNSSGEFNAPFGRYSNPNIVNEITINAVSTYLKNEGIKIINGDYELALTGIRKEGFVYFDPPYEPVSDSSNFTGYTKNGFDRNEQERLKLLCDSLNTKNVKFLLSNSSADFIKDLYKNYIIIPIKAKRVINSIAKNRGEVTEILVKNYE